MSAGDFIFQLLISPLELLLGVIYGMANVLFGNQGLAIVLMSLVMNIFLLPLYKRADAIQAEERAIEKKLEPWVKHIKKTFKGDERFMMLQAYYNINHYKPYYTLKSSLPLALEVPFFIAAYHFLSNLGELNGSSLGPITNLGMPDGLIVLGPLTLNALPILMTLINIISSTIYTKGFAFKDKITLYGMALVFLVLLYNSPSGLVFYWTLNNLFSLVKNLFYKIKNPKKVLFWLVSACGAAAFVFAVFFYPSENLKRKGLVIALAFLMELPLLLQLLKRRTAFPSAVFKLKGSPNYRLFLLGGVFLTLVTGVLIPSAVISSSPQEFVQLIDYYSPIRHIVNATLCAAGTFIIWLGVFYHLSDDSVKRFFDVSIWAVSGSAIVNYMFFGTELGELTPNLTFVNDSLTESGVVFSTVSSTEKLVNLLVIAALTVVFVLLYQKRGHLVKAVYCVLILSVTGLSVFYIAHIQGELHGIKQQLQEFHESETAHFNLSKKGRNVVIVMLDRAISGYIPYIFHEKPELKEQFAGFTYYPNTVSFGGSTNSGTPAIFGGYEYTPEKMNRRADETLASKHDEALKVMPVLFDKNAYDVTICDPVYAGYSWVPDLSVFNSYPSFHVYNTENGQFSPQEELAAQQNSRWKRNFFCYSIMKISPLAAQVTLYASGSYFSRSATPSYAAKDMSHSTGIQGGFAKSFSVLKSLPAITNITDDGNTYLVMANSSTHEACLLEEPSYLPSESIDNAQYDSENQSRFTVDGQTLKVENTSQMEHYHVNMASLIQIGKWLDYLRENEVYDNTRIIIIADHGRTLHQFENIEIDAKAYDYVMAFNPLFMVKDFDAQTFAVDNKLMTTADVPTIAMQDIIDHPVNPFTGVPINSSAKETEELLLYRGEWDIKKVNGNTFLPGNWYSVHDNIFDLNNWKELGTW